MSMILAASEAYRRTVAEGNNRVFCGNIPEGEPDKSKSGYEGLDGDLFVLRDAEGKPLAVLQEDETDGTVNLLRFPHEWPVSAVKDVPEEQERPGN
jgi:hypothetical protein